MFKEFKQFAMKGNMLDMAIGIIIGAAFGKLVTSFVNDILMPPIGLLLGSIDFANLFINLSGTQYDTLAAANAAGAAVIRYGVFVNVLLDLLIVAFVLFLIVRSVNRMRAKMEKPVAAPAAPAMKDCPYCLTSIPAAAKRCAHCTSDLVKGADKAA